MDATQEWGSEARGSGLGGGGTTGAAAGERAERHCGRTRSRAWKVDSSQKKQ